MQENLIRTVKDSIDGKGSSIKVKIERHAWGRMYGWCKAATSEVSGLGLVRFKNGVFHVYDVFFPEQMCTGSYTELDERAQGRLMDRLIRTRRKVEDLRFWWHTHYNFNVFWSGTDDDNARRLMKANGEWELSLVINQKDEWKCRADIVTQDKLGLTLPQAVTIDNLDVGLTKNSKTIRHMSTTDYKDDIKRWVKPFVYTPPATVDHGYQGYGFGRYNWDEYPMGGRQDDWWEKNRTEREERERERKPIWPTTDTPASDRTQEAVKSGKPFRFGKYVVYAGDCITTEQYLKLTGRTWEQDNPTASPARSCYCIQDYTCTACKSVEELGDKAPVQRSRPGDETPYDCYCAYVEGLCSNCELVMSGREPIDAKDN